MESKGENNLDKIRYIIEELFIALSMPISIIIILILIRCFFKNKIKENNNFIKFYKIYKRIIFILVIGFMGIEGLIVSYPKYDNKEDNYIVVLGAGLDNGRTPNLILSERLEAAIKSEKEHPNQYIVVSGGKGKDEYVTEAEAMKKYLEDKGIDEEKIIKEDRSRDTNENLKFSKEKIEEHSNKSISEVNVKIVTADFHAFRSGFLARRNGYVNLDNYSSYTVWYYVPLTYAREAAAVVKSFLFDR